MTLGSRRLCTRFGIVLTALLAAVACNNDDDSGDGFGTLELATSPGSTAQTLQDLAGSAAIHTPADVDVTFTWSWEIDGADSGITTNVVPSTDTAKNETWQVTVVASLGSEGSEQATAQILIVNTPPTVAATKIAANPAGSGICVEVIPPKMLGQACTNDFDCGFKIGVGTGVCEVGALEDSTLSVVTASTGLPVTGLDADLDPVALAYQWSVNGNPLPAETTATLEPSCGCFSVGDVVGASVTPNDGEANGQPSIATPVPIQASPAP